MNVYWKHALPQVPRLLSLCDRNPDSPSYGCFDRGYWKYKTKDYVNIRFQEAALSLALLAKTPGTKWYKNKEIRDLAIAAMHFWAKIQNVNGSFDEYLPNEKSHVATAFSTYAIAKAYRLLNLNDKHIREALIKAAHWLAKNEDTVVANHDAGALAALWHVYKINNSKNILSAFKTKLKLVLSLQTNEGWFYEYGGADIGYQSFTIFYLTDVFQEWKDQRLKDAIEKAIEFELHFIHPDYSMGGCYSSRGTEFVIPAGFELFAKHSKLSTTIACSIQKAVESNRIVTPSAFDDRFVADGLYTFLIVDRPCHGKPLQYTNNSKAVFRQAGLSVIKRGRYYVVTNLRNGGTIKVFKDKKLISQNTGWIAKENGQILSTLVDTDPQFSDVLRATGSVSIVNFSYQTPATLTTVRAASALGASNHLKKMARNLLVSGAKPTKIKFMRAIEVSERGVVITDSFSKKLANMRQTTDFSHVFSTSVGLYTENKGKPLKFEWKENVATALVL